VNSDKFTPTHEVIADCVHTVMAAWLF